MKATIVAFMQERIGPHSSLKFESYIALESGRAHLLRDWHCSPLLAQCFCAGPHYQAPQTAVPAYNGTYNFSLEVTHTTSSVEAGLACDRGVSFQAKHIKKHKSGHDNLLGVFSNPRAVYLRLCNAGRQLPLGFRCGVDALSWKLRGGFRGGFDAARQLRGGRSGRRGLGAALGMRLEAEAARDRLRRAQPRAQHLRCRLPRACCVLGRHECRACIRHNVHVGRILTLNPKSLKCITLTEVHDIYSPGDMYSNFHHLNAPLTCHAAPE